MRNCWKRTHLPLNLAWCKTPRSEKNAQLQSLFCILSSSQNVYKRSSTFFFSFYYFQQVITTKVSPNVSSQEPPSWSKRLSSCLLFQKKLISSIIRYINITILNTSILIKSPSKKPSTPQIYTAKDPPLPQKGDFLLNIGEIVLRNAFSGEITRAVPPPIRMKSGEKFLNLWVEREDTRSHPTKGNIKKDNLLEFFCEIKELSMGILLNDYAQGFSAPISLRQQFFCFLP